MPENLSISREILHDYTMLFVLPNKSNDNITIFTTTSGGLYFNENIIHTKQKNLQPHE